MKRAIETHLSRSEVLELVFGKLQLIQQEAEECTDRENGKVTMAELAAIQRRLMRCALEAKRAASLIETHTHVVKAGHCVHCGKTYEEHAADDMPREGVMPRVHSRATDRPPCLALQRLFDSVELETYQPLRIETVE